MEQVTLEYKRDSEALTSTGVVRTPSGVTNFEGLPFRKMIYLLSEILRDHPEAGVALQRTDRDNLTPYMLDARTVNLIRTDPIGAVEAMEVHPSPSTGVKVAKAARTVVETPPLPAGITTIVEAFGDVLYFRVHAHELECPCCGFWGIWTLPAMLADSERVGTIIRAIYVCPKKCRLRFPVSCEGEWGWVEVEDLLKLASDRFYFPRAWNIEGPWISKDSLRQKYDAYVKEKEQLP